MIDSGSDVEHQKVQTQHVESQVEYGKGQVGDHLEVERILVEYYLGKLQIVDLFEKFVAVVLILLG